MPEGCVLGAERLLTQKSSETWCHRRGISSRSSPSPSVGYALKTDERACSSVFAAVKA